MLSIPPTRHPDYAANLRRLMAEAGRTQAELAEAAGVDLRTVVSILAGNVTPRPRTLKQLAGGLNVAVAELFQNPGAMAHRLFDRRTNPLVDELTAARPELFTGWSENEFDQLYSQFGEGGQLTEEGVVNLVTRMNSNRDLQRKVAIVLESHERDLLTELVETLFRRVVIADGAPRAQQHSSGPRAGV